MLQILQCDVGAPLQINPSHPDIPGTYHPVGHTPLDWGMDLTLYWINNATWIATSRKVSTARVNLNFLKLDYVALWYHFIIRAILADGTQEIFNADDTIKIPISSPVK